MNLANEGTEQRMKEAEVSMKKRKAEDDARWEGMLVDQSPRCWADGNHREPRESCGQLARFQQTAEEEEEVWCYSLRMNVLLNHNAKLCIPLYF